MDNNWNMHYIVDKFHYGGVWDIELGIRGDYVNSYYEEYIGDWELSIVYNIDVKTGARFVMWNALCIGKDIIEFLDPLPISPGTLFFEGE